MPAPSILSRWGWVAALLGGLFLVAKGAFIILSAADPSFVPPATFLFSLGMIGLHARMRGSGGALGAAGAVLAWLAVVASVVNLIGLALAVPAPGDPDAPALLEITYMLAFLGILVGLVLLGIAVLQTHALPPRWRAVPLVVGVLWFPLQGIGFVISDGVGLVLGGLAWVFLGYALRSGDADRK